MEADLYNNNMPQSLTIDLASEDFLRHTAKWGRFLGIMGFIGVGLLVLFGLFAGSLMGNALSSKGNNGMAGFFGGGVFTVFYLVFAGLYFIPVLYLYQFSVKMQEGLRSRNQHQVTASFRNLKSLFKFMGVLTAIFLVLYALAMVFSLIGIGAAAMFS
ncbi:DUF5362 family protein [Pontibacter liquoris]|uniref:DUF5362 family protein n=1 Tax=Pontibacter liquoris TaxID=2905677 RepID=UPI001FA7C0A9|nr:DUF5362 family protein [Pontibacter liquoris]